MATKGPTELELSVLAGYKHPARSLQALRKDILLIAQLSFALKNFKDKKDLQYLRRSLNLTIILSNVFEPTTLEYALFAVLPTEQWVETATILFVLKLSSRRVDIDKDLVGVLNSLVSTASAHQLYQPRLRRM